MNQLSAIAFLQSRILLRSILSVARSWPRTSLWSLNVIFIAVIFAAWSQAPKDLNNWSPPFEVTSCLAVILVSIGLALELAFGIGMQRGEHDDEIYLLALGVDPRVEALRRRSSAFVAGVLVYGFRGLPFAIFLLPHTEAAAALIRLSGLLLAIGALLAIAPLAIALWRSRLRKVVTLLAVSLSLVALATIAALLLPAFEAVRRLEVRMADAFATPMPPLFWIVLVLIAAAIWGAVTGPARMEDTDADSKIDNAAELIASENVLPFMRPYIGRAYMTGAWAELWRVETISWRRGMRNSLSVALAVAVAVGAVGGLIARTANPQVLWFIAFLLANGFIVFNASLTTRTIADVAQPLWWLSADNISYRLGVQAVLAIAPQSIVVLGATASYFAILQPSYIGVASLFSAAMVLLSAAVGAATSVAFPIPLDAYGPGWLLRILSTYAMVFVAFAVPTAILAHASFNIAAITLPILLIAEATALYLLAIQFASRRPERLFF